MTETIESTVQRIGESTRSSSLNEKVNVSIQFTKIEAIREGDKQFSEISYPTDMNLGEAIRRLDNCVTMNFSIKVASDPKVAVFEVKGEAIVRGSDESIRSLTLPEGNSPPPVWKDVYREAMVVISILSRFLNIPEPPSI
ncbi:hypothetical protein MUP77_00180 [Candidatus Bathyarchaeota archaeon]|nr:hypothetical protein [Candidatus Bathyarchaeota archaeon]